jgi:hypothetical protein
VLFLILDARASRRLAIFQLNFKVVTDKDRIRMVRAHIEGTITTSDLYMLHHFMLSEYPISRP